MIATEQEAKIKKCPEGMTRQPAGPATNFRYDTPNCIGSDCMAWRWLGYRYPAGETYFDANFNGTGYPDAPRVGYCGKAGHP